MLYRTSNPHGGDIYGAPVRLDFSANINPFGTPQGILDAVQKSLKEMYRYPDPYCRTLTAAISAFEGVPENQILCGSGAAELIYTYCEAAAPRRAVELAPTFSEYALGLQRMGCEIFHYVLKKEENFDIQEDFLDFIEEMKPDIVFICNPNNPTGHLTSLEMLTKILTCCEKVSSRLFVDECFLDLSDGGQSMKGLLQAHPGLFLLKAFTKSYGMAGIRLGYGLCGDPDLLTRMSRAVQPWNVSSLAQAAGVAALQEQEFLQHTKHVIRQQRQWLSEQLTALGMEVCRSQVNFLLFRGPIGLDRALKEQGIAIRNCDNYIGLEPGWYRIAVKLHEENVQLIQAIAKEKEQLWPKTL